MGSRVMHYIIANGICNYIKVDKNLFVLGNLAADSHDGTKIGNSRAHFRKIVNGNYDNFPNIDLNKFINLYLKTKRTDFELGYFCHLICDSFWVEVLYPHYLKSSMSSEMNSKQRECLFYDLRKSNYILKNQYSNNYSNKLKVPNNINIKEFSLDKFDLLLSLLEEDFKTEKVIEDYKILNNDLIFNYVNESIEKCIIELNKS